MNYSEAIASEYLKTASPLCPLSTSGEGKRFAGVRQKSGFEEFNPSRLKNIFYQVLLLYYIYDAVQNLTHKVDKVLYG